MEIHVSNSSGQAAYKVKGKLAIIVLITTTIEMENATKKFIIVELKQKMENAFNVQKVF